MEQGEQPCLVLTPVREEEAVLGASQGGQVSHPTHAQPLPRLGRQMGQKASSSCGRRCLAAAGSSRSTVPAVAAHAGRGFCLFFIRLQVGLMKVKADSRLFFFLNSALHRTVSQCVYSLGGKSRKQYRAVRLPGVLNEPSLHWQNAP